MPLSSLCLALFACSPQPVAGPGETATTPPATVIPVPSPETRSHAAGWRGRSWLDQHQDGSTHLEGNPVQLVLIGDSITQSFGGEGRQTGQPGAEALAEALPGVAVANQGISGDRTQHVLWRLENAALGGRCPGFIAVMIGTNNLPHDSAEEIVLGIEEIARRIRLACPESTLLLHAVPPRGHAPNDAMRRKVMEVNTTIRTLCTRDGVEWVDPWTEAVAEDGTLNPKVMAGDGVHLAPGGYQAWASALGEHVVRPSTP
ncbi:MAG: GDSL-type esterase/lipase family protein [Phycisphaerales bacterium]|nr:GDSL-type esterase/lipase family protein [Phycisphaerales bacterium]